MSPRAHGTLATPRELGMAEKSGSAEAAVREAAGEKGKGRRRTLRATVRYMDCHCGDEVMELQNYDLES